MRFLAIILLCMLNIIICCTLTIVIPHKIKSTVKSVLITVVGVLLSIILLFGIAILGKAFGILEETKSFILITFAIESLINTIYLFLSRMHWI